MAKHNEKNGHTVAALGGGVLLLWLLLRGKGWGRGDDRSEASSATAAHPATPPRCRVRVDHDGIELDGLRADIPGVVARCRQRGAADVLATGTAISGVVQAVLDALRSAGIKVRIVTPAARPELA